MPGRYARRGTIAVTLLSMGAAVAAAYMAGRAAQSAPDDLASVEVAREALLPAVARGNLPRAYHALRLLTEGDLPLSFADEALTGGLTIWSRPLLVAAATGDENMLRMILGHRGNPADDVLRAAACLARQSRQPGLAETILPGAGAIECVPIPPGALPLVTYSQVLWPPSEGDGTS